MLKVADIPEMPEDPDYGFWTQRDVLAHVYNFARSRRVAPYAVLAAVLRRAVSCIPPHVVLPPTTGGVASVNLFTTVVGVSGAGKGGSEAAAHACIEFPDRHGDSLDADRPNIGTGEGLARLFKGRKDEPGLQRAHLVVPEVSVLAAIAGRQGATLAGQLLSAYMGEPLGFNNSSKDTTTAVEAHSYRLCLGVGTQPANADFFLDREKDGFPQRFLWVLATDPYAPRECPGPVEPITVSIPDFGHGDDVVCIKIPQSARDAIDAHRHQVLTESPDIDPLDGHLMLTQLKVAFALAIIEGRKDVSEDDWKISAELINVSTRTRNRLRDLIAQKRRDANRARANDQAEREAIVSGRLTEDRQHRIGKAILGKLRRVKQCSRSDLRRSVAAELRSDFDPVLETLIDGGFLTPLDGGDGRSVDYQLSQKTAGGV